MLWYQAWIETRWRFAIALGVVTLLAVGTVYDYLAVLKLMPLADALPPDSTSRLRATIELQRSFHGYVWVQWFRQTFANAGTLTAILLGCGTALTRGAEGSVLFTLSLPVRRSSVLRARWTLGLAEWLVVAVVPALAISLAAPAIGQHYRAGEALLHALSAFIGGAVFYSTAALLSTLFADIWRPLLLTCAVAVVAAFVQIFDAGLFPIMSGQRYFYTGVPPWIGWAVCAAVSAALLAVAVSRLERRDF